MKVFFFLLLSFFLVPFSYAEIVDRIVAVINDEIVTESDLRSFSKKIDQNKMIDELLLVGQNLNSLKGDRKAQLDYLINEKILESEITRLNLSVTIERVEQEIRDLARRNGATRAELMSAIKAQGMSTSEYQDFLKSQIERRSLIEREITSKIRVSDEDVTAEFNRQNAQSKTTISEYSLAHILFNPKKGGVAAAKERAELVLNKIKAGQSFDVLAEQNSEDPNFSTGGILGTFKSGEFNKELEVAVSNLGAGEVSGIIESKAGIQIIKVLSKKMTTDPRFEKEKEKIRSSLLEAAFQKHFKLWIESKRDESFVKIN